VPVAVGGGRVWLFRIAALMLVPLFLLGTLELVLRIGGYGYPTSFLLKRQIGGRNVYVENDKFGWRFFPRAVARSPAPLVMAAEKPTNSFRIFLFGESAALGDPEPAYGFGRYLEVLLNERYPETRFEVVRVAMTAINSHAILPIARECAGHDGDLWVIYMGNNEMQGPFGAGTVFGPHAPNLALVRASLALKTSKTGQWIDALLDGLGGSASKTKSWKGMKMFLEGQTRRDDPARGRVYTHFEKNLESILEVARKAHVKVVLSTVASNLKDCAPFASLHPADLSDQLKSAWHQDYREAQAAEAAGQPEEAARGYAKAAEIDAGFAELQFRLGRLQLAGTNLDLARRSFELARDDDALPFRADSRINAIIRTLAGKYSAAGVVLLDAVDALARPGDLAIAGREVFFEHVHLNFDGNYLLARTIAGAVAQTLSDPIKTRGKADWASAEDCANRLALTDWNRSLVYQLVLQRISDAPFTNQLDHADDFKAHRDTLVAIRARLTAENADQARATYRAALERAPDDFLLHSRFGDCLESMGDLAGAAGEWQRACELIPHHPIPWFNAGRLLRRQEKFKEAHDHLARSLEIRPDFADALNELGQVLLKQGKPDEAIAQHRKALQLTPDSSQSHYHLANALAARDKREEAMGCLREAIRLQPGYWEARYFLGVELAVQSRIKEAQEQFAEVVRLRPDYALGHLNLGVALAKQSRLNEAYVQFQETLRLDPKNKSARQHIETILRLQSTRE
jgi:tetratricopeptide (TPR) repeat protein